MARKGYERATIAAIAEAAGLTSGLVHYHFKNKQAILLELVDMLAGGLEQRYVGLVQSATPQQRLEAFIDSHLATGEGADPEAVACWVTIGSEALRQPEVGEVYRRLMERQRDHLVELLKSLPTPPDRPREAAAAILAAIEGCYQLAAAAPELAPPGFASRSLQAMTRGLLRAQSEGAGSSVQRTDPS